MFSYISFWVFFVKNVTFFIKRFSTFLWFFLFCFLKDFLIFLVWFSNLFDGRSISLETITNRKCSTLNIRITHYNVVTYKIAYIVSVCLCVVFNVVGIVILWKERCFSFFFCLLFFNFIRCSFSCVFSNMYVVWWKYSL